MLQCTILPFFKKQIHNQFWYKYYYFIVWPLPHSKMSPRESAVLLSLAVFSVFSFGYLFPFFPVSYWLVSSCSASASCWDCKAVIMWLSLSSPSKNSSAPCSVIPILWSVTRPLGKTCSFLDFEGGYAQEAVQFVFFITAIALQLFTKAKWIFLNNNNMLWAWGE